MKKSLINVIALISTAAVIAPAIPVIAEDAAENEMIISVYDLYMQDNTKVTSNRTYSDSSFSGKNMTPSTTGAYNNKYMTVMDYNSYVDVAIDGLPDGEYSIYQYVPGGSLTAANFTSNYNVVITGSDTYTYNDINMQNQNYGEFNLIAENIKLSGDIHIKYTNNSKEVLRVDTIKLVKTDGEPLPSPTATVTPTSAPTDEPTPTPDADGTYVSNVSITGQTVSAEGYQGLAVDGKCDVNYDFITTEDKTEERAEIKWYKSISEDGEYSLVENASGTPYIISSELGGYYVKAGVTVYTTDGESTEEVFTEPQQVKYKLEFYDEFDYTATNGEDEEFTSRGWKSDKSLRVLGSPTKIYCVRVPENVEVKDGKLRLITRKEHLDKYDYLDQDGHPHTWTTGNVITNEAFGPFGIYDCSYKFGAATGLNQSFWAMSEQGENFVELDFNEGHYPREMATNVHRKVGDRTVQNSLRHYPLGNTSDSPTLADDYHRYTGVVLPNNPNYNWEAPQNADTFQIYFDNKSIRKTKSLQYTPYPVNIYLSVAVYPGSFTGQLVDSEADNSVMEVDYVRYYSFLDTTIADLERLIGDAQELSDGAVIGEANGNYTQDSVDILNTEISNAQETLSSKPDEETVKSAYDTLKSAIETFKRSVIGGYIVKVEGISFVENNIEMIIGKTKQMQVMFTPDDAMNTNVTYSSDKTNVADVDDNGLVTAKTAGTAIITAKSEDGGFETQCTVTVTNLPENQVFYDVDGGKLIFDKSTGEIVDYVGNPVNVVIPSLIDGVNVKSTKINLFKDLQSLKSVEIEKSLVQLADWTFNNCTNLTNVVLPDTLTSINCGAFQQCSSLESIVIPASVKNIEVGAFSACTKLSIMIFEGNIPETIESGSLPDNDTYAMYYYNGAEGFSSPEWNGYKCEMIEGTPKQAPKSHAYIISVDKPDNKIYVDYRIVPTEINDKINTDIMLALYEDEKLVRLIKQSQEVTDETVDGEMIFDGTEFEDNGKTYEIKVFVWEDQKPLMNVYCDKSVDFKVKTLYNSEIDFDGKQGPIWYFQYTTDCENFTDMPTYAADSQVWKADYTYLMVGASKMHPQTAFPVRTFQAPRTGEIVIKESVAKATDSKGTEDGIFIKIVKTKNDGTVEQIYPSDGSDFREIYAAEHLKGAVIPEINLSVEKGERIHFILEDGPSNNINHDGIYWSNELEYISYE